MKTCIKRAALLASVMIFATSLHIASADDVAIKGREILAAHKDAVVTMSIVVGMTMRGEENERGNEATATIISPEGLAVLSLTGVDPTALIQRIAPPGQQISSKVKDVKMILQDGTELPCEVVLRDVELDLAFVRPSVKPTTPMPFVDVTQIGKPEVLDQLFFIGQLGKVARRAHSIFIERVESVIDKPRTFYVPGTPGENRGNAILCSPAFDINGLFVGIGVIRVIKGDNNPMVIILPASDIAEAASQAPEAGQAPVETETPAPEAAPAPAPEPAPEPAPVQEPSSPVGDVSFR